MAEQDYLSDLAHLREEVNRLLERASLEADFSDADGVPPGTWLPLVDIAEDDSSVLILAELPGVRWEDLEIEISKRHVEISGQRRPLRGRRFLRMEAQYGHFKRRIDLEHEVLDEALDVNLDDGVLSIRLQKSLT